MARGRKGHSYPKSNRSAKNSLLGHYRCKESFLRQLLEYSIETFQSYTIEKIEKYGDLQKNGTPE